MHKIFALACCVLALVACDKHDPILPGERTAIFESSSVRVLGAQISDIPTSAYVFDNSNCPYTQDSENVIWDGTRRLFSGFATKNTVASDVKPICDGGYVYAGLTTGELIRVNPKTRQISWIADIYRSSNMTGGASMVDIVSPLVIHGDSVYVGGLGDAFCRVNKVSGLKKWCVGIGVSHPFVIAGNYAFVVSTDDNLYAVRLADGGVMWRSGVRESGAPRYESGVIRVQDDIYNVSDGKMK